jgi:hypothetical protein
MKKVKDLYGAAEQAAEKVGKADPSGADAPFVMTKTRELCGAAKVMP